MYRLLFSSLLVLLLCTCDPAQNTDVAAPSPVGETIFFDLTDYIDAETERLTENKITANKTITLNGKTESKQNTVINYKNDLRLFREADINKPAWSDKYDTDEQKLSGNHRVTTYTTRDSSLIVHRLLVEEDQGVPVRIEIDRKTGTVLSNGIHQLRYESGKGYSVKTQQTNRFGDDVDAVIEVEW